jgi:hypothetical protein
MNRTALQATEEQWTLRAAQNLLWQGHALLSCPAQPNPLMHACV